MDNFDAEISSQDGKLSTHSLAILLTQPSASSTYQERILRENEKPNFIQRTHKEEAKGRISADQADREGLRKKLEMCINPLDPEQHRKTIIDMVNGMIGPASVNVDEAIDIGRRHANGGI